MRAALKPDLLDTSAKVAPGTYIKGFALFQVLVEFRFKVGLVGATRSQ